MTNLPFNEKCEARYRFQFHTMQTVLHSIGLFNFQGQCHCFKLTFTIVNQILYIYLYRNKTLRKKTPTNCFDQNTFKIEFKKDIKLDLKAENIFIQWLILYFNSPTNMTYPAFANPSYKTFGFGCVATMIEDDKNLLVIVVDYHSNHSKITGLKSDQALTFKEYGKCKNSEY